MILTSEDIDDPTCKVEVQGDHPNQLDELAWTKALESGPIGLDKESTIQWWEETSCESHLSAEGSILNVKIGTATRRQDGWFLVSELTKELKRQIEAREGEVFSRKKGKEKTKTTTFHLECVPFETPDE